MTQTIDSPEPIEQSKGKEETSSKKSFPKKEKKVLSPEALLRIKRLEEALLWLCETFPEAFSSSDPKPLKMDILKDIFPTLSEDKGISRKSIREVVAFYVKKGTYHRALIQSTHRVNLSGQPVQDIEPAHKTYAQGILEARRLKQLERKAKRKKNKEKAEHKD
jgi:ProP effector